MGYNTTILKAYLKYRESENKVPDFEYEPNYKSKQSKAQAAWRIFANSCKEYGIAPVKTAFDIDKAINPNPLLIKSAK